MRIYESDITVEEDCRVTIFELVFLATPIVGL